MNIPQPVLDAFASIQADNPPPDVTNQPITAALLASTETQLVGWRQALSLVRNQMAAAEKNVQTLEQQVAALQALLAVQ